MYEISSTGKLIYSDNPAKCIILIDQEIGNYYRWFIPKYIRNNRPLHPFHISVVRNEVRQLKNWKKYEGVEIDFQYSPFIMYNETYIWLPVKSDDLKSIRVEMGLPSLNWVTRSPSGDNDFHITIANMKNF